MQAIRRLASHCSEALAARFRQGLLPRRQGDTCHPCVTLDQPWTDPLRGPDNQTFSQAALHPGV